MRISQGKRLALWGAATAVVLSTVGVINMANAGGAPSPSTFVPITPCRLADTRSDSNVGPLKAPIGPAQTATFQVTGTNGNCTIPAGSTGIATNVTAVNPTATSFLTVFPADAAQPLSSNLNWNSTSSPTPNQVTVSLSASGAIKAFNNGGNIDIVIDIVGYYETAATAVSYQPDGGPGDVLPSGKTIYGALTFGDYAPVGEHLTKTYTLPVMIPVPLTDATVNFAKDNYAQTVDDDPDCTGSYLKPTAPAGKLCIYYTNGGIANLIAYAPSALPQNSFTVNWTTPFPDSDFLVADWAYTAP